MREASSIVVVVVARAERMENAKHEARIGKERNRSGSE